MNTKFKSAVAALAFATFVAQPISASAIENHVYANGGGTGTFILPLWMAGSMLCIAMTVSKWAPRAAEVSHADFVRAKLRCAIPIIGFHLLINNQ